MSTIIKSALKAALERAGYQIVQMPAWSIRKPIESNHGYRIVKWKASEGNVDIVGYQTEQEKGNRAKIDQIWASEANLKYLCQWLKTHQMKPNFVVCHGTRNGFEQRVFADSFGCQVIGTEISSTAVEYPMTVQADFHDLRPEWEGKVDVVYSNSLDHAYDPEKALRAWSQTVKDGGVIVLDKASDSDPHAISDLDPFGIRLPEMLHFVLEKLGSSVSVRALLPVPEPKAGTSYHKLIILKIDRRNAI